MLPSGPSSPGLWQMRQWFREPVRFMERNRVDDLERALGLLDWTRLNEFKHTQIPR